MSRRRRGARRAVTGEVRLSVECDGREDHHVERIARVRLIPRPDLGKGDYAVKVEYVRVEDDPEDNDDMMPTRLDGPRPHMTRRFRCRKCRRDVPLEDEHLVRAGILLDTLGQHHLRLREVSAIVSNE